MRKLLIVIQLLVSVVCSAQTINGQIFPDGIDISPTAPSALTFTNNLITGVDTGSHLVLAGSEASSSKDHFLDGAILTGNKLIWTGAQVEQEGYNVGFNTNDYVKHNYFDGVTYAVVFKSGNPNMTYTSGGFAYNIVRNSSIAVRVKGMNGVSIYNNTFYSVGSGNATVFITNNQGIGSAGSTGTKLYNNIFYTTHAKDNIYIETDSLSGFECDYNVYYSEAGAPTFNVSGAVKSWAQWRALGYDTHSVIVDPGFVNSTDLVPSARLDYGTDLGTTWRSGLSTSATWILGMSPSTADQNGTWQVGARIYGATPAPLDLAMAAVDGAVDLGVDGPAIDLGTDRPEDLGVTPDASGASGATSQGGCAVASPGGAPTLHVFLFGVLLASFALRRRQRRS